MSYLFAIGFISILGQVVLLRELSVAFYGIELIYTLALGIWLLFSACGTMLGQKHSRPSFASLNILFLLLSIGIPLDLAFIRDVRPLFSDAPGAYLPLHMQILIMALSLLPIGLLLGLQFQWAARIYVAQGKKLADAYAIECLGGMAGGIAATLFLKFGFQNFTIALLCSFFALGASFLSVGKKGLRWLYPIAIMLSAALLLLLWKSHEVDRFLTSWTHPDLLETRDSPYSRITTTFLNGQVSVFENDALVFDTQSTQAEEFVHLAALQHANPDRVLILGGGIEGLVLEVQKYEPRIVDYVELNPVLLDTVFPELPVEIQKSLQAENVRITIEDPRKFLSRALSYDLILVGMPEPSSGQANRYYTREFFQQCYAKLNPRGILAFRLQSSENFWTPQLTRRMVSIYRAAKSAFPEVTFIPGSTNVVIGSRDSLPTDVTPLLSRLESRRIKARLIIPRYLRYLYANDRFLEVNRSLRHGSGVMNTDMQPICYQYTILIWLAKFFPSSASWNLSLPDSWNSRNIFRLMLFSLPLLLLSLARWPIRRAFLMAIGAFAGMVMETILILHYQTKHGILFQDIGILLTTFMAGLALGSSALARRQKPFKKLHGILLLAGFVLVSSSIGWRISCGGNSGLIETSCFLALSGLLVAGIFAYASLRLSADQSGVIAPLYAADLIGGCLGSIITSLILAPLAGLSVAAFLIVPFSMFSVLLL